MSIKLSISIVAYKNYDEIKKAISSIENFTSTDLKKEIYIIDNSIANESEAVNFQNYLKGIKGTYYINANDNLGYGKGHNQILNRIDSEYHAIINPDILLIEDSFSKIINWMDSHSEIGMCIPVIIDEKGNIQRVYRKELTVFDLFNRMFLKELFKKRALIHTMMDQDYTKPFEVPFAQGSFLIIRSELFKKLNGFDENYFMYVEDADFCKRVNQISKLMYYPDTKVIHQWHKESHKNGKLFKYHLKSIHYYFKKWGLKII